jgi:hypothetical protein
MLPKTTQYKRAKDRQHTFLYRQWEITGISNMALYCGKIKCPKCNQKGYLSMRQHGQFQVTHQHGRKNHKMVYTYHTISNLHDIINKYLKFLTRNHNTSNWIKSKN